MQKCIIGLEKKFRVTTLLVPFLCILVFAMIVTRVAKADSPIMWLEPSQGPAGSTLIVHTRGLPGPTLDIAFGTISVGNATTWPGTNSANRLITVPQVPPGMYTINATSNMGFITATFTVTQDPSPTPPETSDGTPTGSGPAKPSVAANTGFWSPLAIAITSAVITVAIFATTLYVKRGKQQRPQYQETPHYEPRLTVPSNKPNTPTKNNQPTNKSQQQPFTKICQHCKQAVRDDLNVCPYCFKRLR